METATAYESPQELTSVPCATEDQTTESRSFKDVLVPLIFAISAIILGYIGFAMGLFSTPIIHW